MLFASTAIAATFCLAYITKPVIVTGPTLPPSNSTSPQSAANVDAHSTNSPIEKILPDNSKLPGEKQLSPLMPHESGLPLAPLSVGKNYEETNIRMQHILDTESPSGDMDRIVVDVPALYESRNLRWTQEQAAQARSLMARLTEHQQKTRELRDEGTLLLEDWNQLMETSIPTQVLRADSPSIPSNQINPKKPVSPTSDNSVNIQPIKN
ncbi:MAG: hypothetical protein AB8D78_03075 [Akkermansiaceae bacterium]